MSGVRGGRWLWRQVRGARPDRNPLRRSVDRLETGLVAGLVVAAAAAAPFAARAAGQAAYHSALQARHEQLSTRFEVRAVLIEQASTNAGYALAAGVPDLASWTSVGGVHRAGEIPVQPGSPAGTTVPVWTDASGYLVSPPLNLADAAGDADAASTCAVAGMLIACGLGAMVTRKLMNRHRMAAWEADWLATAPTWNRQRW
jgi:hypothetical protein